MSGVLVTIGDWQRRCTGALHVVVAALRLSPNATRAFVVLRAESRVLTVGLSPRGMDTASI